VKVYDQNGSLRNKNGEKINEMEKRLLIGVAAGTHKRKRAF